MARELFIDRTIHVVALIAAAIGSVILLLSAGNTTSHIGIWLYLIGLLATLGCSTLHNWQLETSHKELLRRLDHAAIFLLIAGTYSPFMIALTGDLEATIMFAFVWTTAAAGFLLKLFRPASLGRLWTTLYLVVGWSGALILGRLAERLPMEILWLIGLGGVLYTVGLIFHIWRGLPYQNAIWHGFVVAASAIHYVAVLDLVTS